MKKESVKDLMVPISEYAAVRVGTSLLDAMYELEKVQEEFTTNKYQHRAILVLDNEDLVIGKIGQLRILKAIESWHETEGTDDDLKTFRFSERYIARRREHHRMQGPVLNREILLAACGKKVEDFMQKPTHGEFVSEDCALDVAIHRLVAGAHLSLLVTSGKKIVGILRIADVCAAVFHEMKDIDTKEPS